MGITGIELRPSQGGGIQFRRRFNGNETGFLSRSKRIRWREILGSGLKLGKFGLCREAAQNGWRDRQEVAGHMMRLWPRAGLAEVPG